MIVIKMWCPQSAGTNDADPISLAFSVLGKSVNKTAFNENMTKKTQKNFWYSNVCQGKFLYTVWNICHALARRFSELAS